MPEISKVQKEQNGQKMAPAELKAAAGGRRQIKELRDFLTEEEKKQLEEFNRRVNEA